ncbi:hypothetical protein SLA2020_083700 [Shorea laevis]
MTFLAISDVESHVLSGRGRSFPSPCAYTKAAGPRLPPEERTETSFPERVEGRVLVISLTFPVGVGIVRCWRINRLVLPPELNLDLWFLGSR